MKPDENLRMQYRSLITVYDVKLLNCLSRIERIIASVDRGDQRSRMATLTEIGTPAVCSTGSVGR